MSYYRNNEAVLRRCQLAHDRMEPPEYWEGEDDSPGSDEVQFKSNNHAKHCVCSICQELDKIEKGEGVK